MQVVLQTFLLYKATWFCDYEQTISCQENSWAKKAQGE